MTQIPAYFGSTEAPQSVSHQTKPDRRLLRVRDERPPSDGVADKCNEFPVASMASPLPRATPGRSKYISNPRMRTVLVPLQNRPLLMMMVRGGGFPTSPLAFRLEEWVRPFGASLPMRMTASCSGLWTYRIQGCGAIQPRPKAQSPLIVIPAAPQRSKPSR